MVTQQGHPVLSQEGAPIIIDPTIGWSFEEHGVIRNGQESWTMGLVRPQHLSDLARVGENTFRALGPTEQLFQEERNIRSEYLEKSGVNPTSTMMNLIETSRAFETNVQMIRNHDHVTGALVNRMLRQQ